MNAQPITRDYFVAEAKRTVEVLRNDSFSDRQKERAIYAMWIEYLRTRDPQTTGIMSWLWTEYTGVIAT